MPVRQSLVNSPYEGARSRKRTFHGHNTYCKKQPIKMSKQMTQSPRTFMDGALIAGINIRYFTIFRIQFFLPELHCFGGGHFVSPQLLQ